MLFQNIHIEKSGKDIKDACLAKINKEELKPKMTDSEKAQVDVMSRNLVDSYRYNLTLEEAMFLEL